eukprot:2239120-Pyramimonas_sp.AAC.1
MFPSDVRDPRQANQGALPVAAQTERCMEIPRGRRWRSMPFLASIAVACCPRARILSSVPFALKTAFAVSLLRHPLHRSRIPLQVQTAYSNNGMHRGYWTPFCPNIRSSSTSSLNLPSSAVDGITACP